MLVGRHELHYPVQQLRETTHPDDPIDMNAPSAPEARDPMTLNTKPHERDGCGTHSTTTPPDGRPA